MGNYIGTINSVQETAVTLANNSANIAFSSDVLRTRSANCCGCNRMVKPFSWKLTISNY